jgi:nucleoside-diphosphate-sugar epimerase
LCDAIRAIAHIIERNLFDGRVYNVLTLNATVRDLVEAIAKLLPDPKLSFVDSPIMNQLSYEVSAQRFIDRGFTFTGDLQRGIGGTVSLLQAAQYRA